MSLLRVLLFVVAAGVLAAFVMAGASPAEGPVSDRIAVTP